LLSRKKVQNQIAILAPKSKPTSRGIVLDFSGLPQGDSSNFKSNLVQSIKAKGTRVVYIGDGFSDLEAIKEASIRFVIKGSRLAEQCKKDDIVCNEIVGLEEVNRYLTGPRTHGRAQDEAKVA
jgi:3-deoxy-D-manno-octulosonate 8-phosphate phosphatase KdsC-like HAD superfamily phosphatase